MTRPAILCAMLMLAVFAADAAVGGAVVVARPAPVTVSRPTPAPARPASPASKAAAAPHATNSTVAPWWMFWGPQTSSSCRDEDRRAGKCGVGK